MPLSPPVSTRQSVSSLHRKRRNVSDFARESPPAKRTKPNTAASVASNYPPEFWDHLSKNWLTPRALRELDRRNDSKRSTVEAGVPSSPTPATLRRFARHGGPDLRHLRGVSSSPFYPTSTNRCAIQYPEPKGAAQMSSQRSLASSRQTQSTKATSVSSKGKRSSAYGKDFEQSLIDHGIYPEGYEHNDDRATPEPKNLDDIVELLAHPRASLSPSQFPTSTFKKFRQANSSVISEGKVMSDIFPTIRGSAEIPNEGNLPFTNLDSITESVTVDAVPDFYDGSHSKDIDKSVREALSKVIVPTNHGRAPLAPNFFVEAKAPRGGADVAKRQACLDGAVGARAMHSLQNFGEEVPIYDGRAHSFSSTYHAGTGTLQLYAHHATGPKHEEGRPEYHMTQIDGWQMTGNIDTFRRGATAFRNARDLARHHRETFIKGANARALETEPGTAARNTDHTCRLDAVHRSTTSISEWQTSHDDVQQQIAESYYEECEGKTELPTTPRLPHESDESQGSEEDAASETDVASTSFASNMTSSFNADSTSHKRSCPSSSSPQSRRRSSKSRSWFTAPRQPGKPLTTLAEPDACDSNVFRERRGDGFNEKTD